MTPLYTNNAATTLASGINSTATSITVATGTGYLFPSPTNGNYFYLTLQNTAGSIIEIVKCTSRSTDTLTIVRGQDNTNPMSFSTGDKVELRLNAGGIQDFVAYARGFRTRYFSKSGTYTPASDVNQFWVFVFGSNSTNSYSRGGAGGTGYSEKYYSSPGSSYSYTIGAAGTLSQGGITTFDVISVTGASPGLSVSPYTGGAGGVASGGDFNANGGNGGLGVSAVVYAGSGGPGTRAGVGGNGGAATSTLGGGAGGTGGNNASGQSGGAAASSPSASALSLPWFPIETFSAGGNGSSNNDGNKAPAGIFMDGISLPFDSINTSSVNSINALMTNFGTSSNSNSGIIFIVEGLK